MQVRTLTGVTDTALASLVWRSGQLAWAHGWDDRAVDDLTRLATGWPADRRAVGRKWSGPLVSQSTGCMLDKWERVLQQHPPSRRKEAVLFALRDAVCQWIRVFHSRVHVTQRGEQR